MNTHELAGRPSVRIDRVNEVMGEPAHDKSPIERVLSENLRCIELAQIVAADKGCWAEYPAARRVCEALAALTQAVGSECAVHVPNAAPLHRALRPGHLSEQEVRE